MSPFSFFPFSNSIPGVYDFLGLVIRSNEDGYSISFGTTGDPKYTGSLKEIAKLIFLDIANDDCSFLQCFLNVKFNPLRVKFDKWLLSHEIYSKIIQSSYDKNDIETIKKMEADFVKNFEQELNRELERYNSLFIFL
jgi:hypothetical protein